MTTSVRAWWAAPQDLKLGHGDGRAVVVGETLTVDGDIVPCERGLHASIKPLDMLQYGSSPIICRVEVGGTIVHQDDKLAGSERTVIAMADCTKVLRLFAAWCAEQALKNEEAHDRIVDPRSRNAIAVARKHANGEATDDELAAAETAAWAAAETAARAAAETAARAAAETAARAAAARAAARTAAWAAAARAAARTAAWAAADTAARTAAWAAAETAARAAAWAAARAAARAAAWAAARAAARAAQNAELERLLLAEFGLAA